MSRLSASAVPLWWLAGIPFISLVGPEKPDDPPVVIGRVSDAATGRPLLGTQVALWQNGTEVVAPVPLNANGFFTLSPPSEGVYRLAVSADGYESLLLDTLSVHDDETLEVMLRVTPAQRLEPRWWNITRYQDGECEEWEPYEQLVARRTGRPVLEWRWRLCNHSLEEYEVQLQIASKMNDRIELDYRLSTRPDYCQGTQARTPLGDRVRGTLRLRATQRSRHRGRPGIIPKAGFDHNVYICATWQVLN